VGDVNRMETPTRFFTFFMFFLIGLLLLIELYIGASWLKNDVLFHMDVNNIVDANLNSIVYHSKQSDENYYTDYSFTIYQDSLTTADEKVYMMIYQPDNQNLELTLNGRIISTYDEGSNFQVINHHLLLIIPVNPNDLVDINNFSIKIDSNNKSGIYNDIFFIDEDLLRFIEILIAISHAIKSFVVYGGIMLAIGSFGFSKAAIHFEDKARAKAYQLASVSLFFLVLHDISFLNVIPISNRLISDHLLEDFSFMIALTLFTFAMYIQIKDKIILRIGIFQSAITITFIITLSIIRDAFLIIPIVKFSVFLVTLMASNIYLHSPLVHHRKVAKTSVKVIILILIIGQIVEILNTYMNLVPYNVSTVFTKVLPIAAGMTLVLKNVCYELSAIRERNEEERAKLKRVNKNIYEYVSEGIFSVSDNLIINDMYTKVCQKIFGRDLSDVKISYLLEDEDTPADFIDRLFKDLFSGKIPWVAGIELLPVELIINEKTYELTYQKILEDNRIAEIIIKVTDRTYTKKLQSRITLERDKLALSITSVMNREELLPLVNEFIEYMDDMDSETYTREELLNTIHTYKGNFGVFNFINILKALHEFEAKLLRDEIVESSDVSFIVKELYKDLEIITEITGSSFFEDTIYLKANVNNLETVYSEVKKYFYDTEASLIIFIIKKIFNKSMKDIILFYAREARKKAGERGKEMKTIAVVGDDVFIDYNYYKSAIRSLVHVFNNCIDHGIEDEEERLILGKPKFGEIQCRISDYGNFFEIVIKDDGRGIALERLAEGLIENEIITQEELEQLSEEELMEYVFLAEVSTQDEASLTSGRGVGLASVKNEVEKVGGEIRIVSFVDFGTEVKILLPKENEALISYFSLPLLMDLYVEAFKIYVKSNNIFDLPLNIVGSEKVAELYDFNVQIKFEGPEVGYFFMSCNEDVMWKLASYLTENLNLTKEEFDEVAWEVVKETCNIVAGNSTSIFDLSQKYINILSPAEVEKEMFDKGNLIYKWHMKYVDYGVILGLAIE